LPGRASSHHQFTDKHTTPRIPINSLQSKAVIINMYTQYLPDKYASYAL